ncbi:DNAJ protein-like protein [Strigomonas culicis]|uniref:DNAJ protein-like protein n=1 Tax=Strigomonas culicis TaxID=28005 RepID=S9VXJ0_9TRYP|nr:DNAJ protein-like protein [Strigomonas culicis]|eukprot:EPY31766.1 DNAJ protein-like protein [Strigomonas culicis]
MSTPTTTQTHKSAESVLDAFENRGKKENARFGNKNSLEHLTRNKDNNKINARLLALMNYYDVLGVSSTADEETIKRAYKRKALELHPDRVGRGQTAEEAELFKVITKANEVLTDAGERAKYDQQLRTAGYGAPAPQAPPTDSWYNQF